MLTSLPDKINGVFPAGTFPGLYPIVYITKDADVLCGECAAEWEEDLAGCQTHMEGEDEICVHCNVPIESAYGPIEE